MGVVGCGVYLCLYYHDAKKGRRGRRNNVVPVVSYITLWNGFLAVGFCFWPSHQMHRLEVQKKKMPREVGFMMGAMFVFSNLALLLSKLLHSTADSPSRIIEWEDKTPLNVAAVASFLLGACLLTVVLILYVFLADFMAADDGAAGPMDGDHQKDEENTTHQRATREMGDGSGDDHSDDDGVEYYHEDGDEDWKVNDDSKGPFSGKIKVLKSPKQESKRGDERDTAEEKSGGGGSPRSDSRDHDAAMKRWWLEWRRRRKLERARRPREKSAAGLAGRIS